MNELLHDEKHKRSSLGEDRKELIAEAIEDSRGRISVREVSRSTDILSASAHRIMRKSLSLKPLKFAMMQALEPHDYQKRVELGNWFYDNEATIRNILWSDKAYLHIDGSISRYHCRICSQNNPRQFLTKLLHPEKICVWFGFTSTCIVPYFF